MNIGEILIWESTNALLLIPTVIGLVMLIRWIRGKPVFTDRDWLFLFGHPRENTGPNNGVGSFTVTGTISSPGSLK
jgi:hypothetical protein